MVLPWPVPLLRRFSKDCMIFHKAIVDNDNCCDTLIALREKKNRDGEQSDDYVFGYLSKMQQKQQDDNNGTFTRLVLLRNVVFLYAPARDPLTMASTWTCLYLVKYPEFQEKIRDEIMNVIGTRSPSYQDKQQMPFTMAFIHEVLRITPPITFNSPRRATADVKVGNHVIPKGTSVSFNLWAANHDPKIWANPESFDPGRFLSDDGGTFILGPSLTSFGGGKRVCPGQSMAKVQLFYFIVSLLQKFRLLVSEGAEVSDQEQFGAVIQPVNMPDICFEALSCNQ